MYAYDDLNRNTTVTRYVDGMNDEIMFTASYDVESLLTHIDYGNGVETLLSYTYHKPLEINVKNGETSYLDLEYTHDGNGNITELENGWRDINSSWHSQTESYTYDGLDRLVSAQSSLWSHTYSYDKAGNRMTEDGVTYTVNALNEVTSLSDGTEFTYDSNGNRTEKTKGSDSWVYTYEYADKLTEVEKNQTVIGEYVYDGDGRRIQSTESEVTKTYLYAGASVLCEETDAGSANYIYGPTGLLAKRTTINEESHTFYYHTDHQGSTRLVTDEDRNVVSSVSYHPFGEWEIEGSEQYLYTAKERDDTGLFYYGARYYDPDTGRFITRDLVAGERIAPQSLNLYSYCLNNPVNLVDPLGLGVDDSRICEHEGGNMVCFDFFADGSFTVTGYYNGDTIGKKITDSKELQQLLSRAGKSKEQIMADQARAAYLMFLITHPEIQGDPKQKGEAFQGGYLFQATVGREEVDLWIIVREEFESDVGDYATTGIRGHVRENGQYVTMLRITIYQAAFQSIAHLYHIVGHEGVHVIELLKYGRTSETNAYKWNLAHLMRPFPYPFNALELLRIYQYLTGKAHSAVPT